MVSKEYLICGTTSAMLVWNDWKTFPSSKLKQQNMFLKSFTFKRKMEPAWIQVFWQHSEKCRMAILVGQGKWARGDVAQETINNAWTLLIIWESQI